MLRLRLVRYAGLTGAALLALAAGLGGVLPRWRPGVTPVSIWQGEHGPLTVVAWLLGTGLLAGAWWTARDRVPSVRWAYVTVGLWLLPLLLAPPLGSRDIYSYACQGAVYAAGHDPYAAGVAAYGCPWLESVSPIWREVPAPYGPVFVVLAGAAAALGGTLPGTLALLRLLALAGIVLTAVCLPPLARRCAVPPERALWLVLACPLVGVHLVSGAHNDALMVGLLVAGLLGVVARPGRPATLSAGGALLGLAVLVKATAVVVLPFAVLAAVVGPYRGRALVRDGGWVAGGAVVASLAAMLGSGLGFGWVAGLAHSGDSIQWTSPPTAFGMTVDQAGRVFGLRLDAVPVARTVAVLALAVVLVLLWWRLWRRAGASAGGAFAGPAARDQVPRDQAIRDQVPRGRVALYGAGLALAATVVFAPVFHPWYATWPLAVLAATAARTGWFAVPCLVASFLTLPDGTNLARFIKFPGALLMSALVVVLAWRALPRTRSR